MAAAHRSHRWDAESGEETTHRPEAQMRISLHCAHSTRDITRQCIDLATLFLCSSSGSRSSCATRAEDPSLWTWRRPSTVPHERLLYRLANVARSALAKAKLRQKSRLQ